MKINEIFKSLVQYWSYPLRTFKKMNNFEGFMNTCSHLIIAYSPGWKV